MNQIFFSICEINIQNIDETEPTRFWNLIFIYLKKDKNVSIHTHPDIYGIF